MLYRFFLIILVSILGISNVSAQEQLPDNLAGALCLVRADDQIVLVDEIITGQLSLPGGTIVAGEPAYVAAQRETWEEAGLAVTVGDVLGYTDGAVVFDCISDSEIISYDIKNEIGGFELPIWFAPHYGVEVSRAMLLTPGTLDAKEY
ncbi:NUDIX hydrolase, partial [Vibrio fortis]